MPRKIVKCTECNGSRCGSCDDNGWTFESLTKNELRESYKRCTCVECNGDAGPDEENRVCHVCRGSGKIIELKYRIN